MKRKIVILGAGESGVGAAILAQKEGFDVFVSDFSKIKDKYKEQLNKHNIKWEEGHHSEDLVLSADEIVKSPGIPDKAAIIQNSKKKNIPILSEIEFAGRYTKAKMIGITGSNGKTTTTMLTYHILKSAGLNVGLAGNVGQSLALQVAEKKYDIYVIELSSFQLDNMYNFKADISILMNISPDHLDRYNYEMQQYIDAKFRILQNQTENDAFIFWNEDPYIQTELKKRNLSMRCFPFDGRSKDAACIIDNNKIYVPSPYGEFVFNMNDCSLMGKHNMYNAMAAVTACKLLNIENEKIVTGLKSFKSVEHRLEFVRKFEDVIYINDSKATNVQSCYYALEAVTTPIVLILGGTDKGNDYGIINPFVEEKVHTLIFLGVDNKKLVTFFSNKGYNIAEARSMKEAVSKAHEFSNEGDTVLLSPCCASFDLFNNYEDRGDQFKACVLDL